MTIEYRCEGRWVTDTATLDTVRALCTASGKFTWITRHVRLRVHTFRGVPGKLCDLLLPEAVDASCPMTCEVGRKVGCFDGAVRWRVTFRPWLGGVCREGNVPSIEFPGPGTLRVDEQPDGLEVIARWQGGMWAQLFHQLRYSVEPGSRRAIFMAQWKGWYTNCIPFEDASQTADLFDSLPAVQQATDIVALNRMASNLLYDLAQQLGWRKLTLREKAKYSLAPDSPQWQRRDGLLARLVAREGTPTGTGQFTLDAASGTVAVRMPSTVCEQCQELRSDCHCHHA